MIHIVSALCRNWPPPRFRPAGKKRRKGRKGRRNEIPQAPQDVEDSLDLYGANFSPDVAGEADNQVPNEVVPRLDAEEGREGKRRRGGRRRRPGHRRGRPSTTTPPPVVTTTPATTTTTTTPTTTTTTSTTTTTPATTVTTEVLYDSTGYPQDSSYSAVEPQYTIEGREVERTIVDFVPESPSGSSDEDALRKNAVEEELKYHEKDTRGNGRGRRKKKGKNKKNKKADKSHGAVDKPEYEAEDVEDTYGEVPESEQGLEPREDEAPDVLEDLPEGYPTDRFMQRGSNSNYSRLAKGSIDSL